MLARICLASLLAVATASQVVFGNNSPTILSDVPKEQFTILKSENHPNHQVRIKSHTGWCDPKVKSYTGYIDTGNGKNLFFYFFESRHKPSEDPVAMWINGGPGGSSAMGLFMEQGPCRIKENPTSINDTYVNPYAWNDRANIFFLDQPIGVGFSHAHHGQLASTTEEAAKDVAAFVDIFFTNFKEYEGRPFHMSGESYGGRYLPVFASAVYDQNALLVKQGKTPINLKSVMIGNGATSFLKLYESIYEMMCKPVPELGRTISSIEHCVSMAERVPRCKQMMKRDCLDSFDITSCGWSLEFCMVLWSESATLAGVSNYNVNQSCTQQEQEEYGCMKAELDVQKYLNLPETRALLGVDKHVKEFKLSSRAVNMAFMSRLDFAHQTYYYVANLLERGVKILNYVGTLDAACDHFGQAKWMAEMEWSGRENYVAAPTEDWIVDGHVAGSYKTYGNLALLKVFGAGHLVPTDKPKESLVLFNDWIASA